MARYLTGRAVNLSHSFHDDETETDLTPASVTVTVTAVGASVATVTGPATKTGAVYTFTAGALPEGIYAVLWNGGATATDTEWIEVAGGRLFSVPYVRAKDADLTAQRFPAEDVTQKRETVESEFERITGRSFIPVTRRIRVELDGSDSKVLPVRDVRALVALSGPIPARPASPTVAVDVSTLDVDPDGILSGLCLLPTGVYVATVAYGFTTPPADIKRAGLIRIRSLLMEVTSGIPDRATSFQPGDGGTYTLSTPGRGGSRTGIPDVDATLADYTYDIVNSILGGLS